MNLLAEILGVLIILHINCFGTSSDDNCERRSEGCCEGFMFSDALNKCVECSVGYFGGNCTMPCPYPSHGRGCQMLCNCARDVCDFRGGCEEQEFVSRTPLETFNTTSRDEEKSKKSSNTSLKYVVIGLITLLGFIIILYVGMYLIQKR